MVELKISDRFKNAVRSRTFRRSLFMSATLLAIAWLFEMARLVITAEMDVLSKLLFFFVMWLILGVIIWILTLINPEFMERIAKTLGFEREKTKRK